MDSKSLTTADANANPNVDINNFFEGVFQREPLRQPRADSGRAEREITSLLGRRLTSQCHCLTSDGGGWPWVLSNVSNQMRIL